MKKILFSNFSMHVCRLLELVPLQQRYLHQVILEEEPLCLQTFHSKKPYSEQTPLDCNSKHGGKNREYINT